MAVSPEAGAAFARSVLEVYAETERIMLDSIARRLERGIDGPNWYEDKIAQIGPVRRELERQIRELEAGVRAEVESNLLRAYHTGVRAADREMIDVGLSIAGNFAGTSLRPVQVIVEETLQGLASTHFRILRQFEDVYRDAVIDPAGQLTSGGLTRREASGRVLEDFARRGVTGFTDRAGRNWSLEPYAEMTMRTAAGRAHVEGALRRFDGLGDEGDLVIVSDSPEECPLCRPWEGKVLSRSGRSREYPTVDQAISDGLFHPNCTHAFGLYVPGLTKPMRDTENPVGYEERQEQRRLERKVREWRRRELAALDPDRRRKAQAARRGWERELSEFVEATDRKRLRYREVPFMGSSGGGTVGPSSLVPVSTAPRGELLRDSFPKARAYGNQARRPNVQAGLEDRFRAAATLVDEAAFDVSPGVRDWFAGVAGRLNVVKFDVHDASKPIQTLGSTTARGARSGSTGVARYDSADLMLEFNRTWNEPLAAWNKRARDVIASGERQGLTRAEADERLRSWVRENPPPPLIAREAAEQELAETLAHELAHAADFFNGERLSQAVRTDGVFDEIKRIYGDGTGEATFWYAASEPAEAVAELVRFYLFGEEPRFGVRGRTANEWRQAFPTLAGWVERRVFSWTL